MHVDRVVGPVVQRQHQLPAVAPALTSSNGCWVFPAKRRKNPLGPWKLTS